MIIAAFAVGVGCAVLVESVRCRILLREWCGNGVVSVNNVDFGTIRLVSSELIGFIVLAVVCFYEIFFEVVYRRCS